MEKSRKNTQFAVLGLGRFGISVVQTLAAMNKNVLAVDNNPTGLHAVSSCATAVVQADVSDEEAMRKLGLGNFDVVVIAMVEDFEASVMATMMAKEQGAGYVLVKARGHRQKAILEKIGADRVVLPEFEMGARVAHTLARPNVLDVLEDTGDTVITEMHPNAEWVGKTVRDSNIRNTSGLMILSIRRGSHTIIPVLPEEVIEQEDILITMSSKNN